MADALLIFFIFCGVLFVVETVAGIIFVIGLGIYELTKYLIARSKMKKALVHKIWMFDEEREMYIPCYNDSFCIYCGGGDKPEERYVHPNDVYPNGALE
jgi:hypothetical protein